MSQLVARGANWWSEGVSWWSEGANWWSEEPTGGLKELAGGLRKLAGGVKEPAGEPMDAISLNTTNNIWYTSIKLMEKQISVFACSFSIPWPPTFSPQF